MIDFTFILTVVFLMMTSIGAKAQNVQTDSTAPATQIYGIDGKRRNTMRRGLNIVRSQGKARKVVI